MLKKINSKLNRWVEILCQMVSTKTFFVFTILLSLIPVMLPFIQDKILYISNTFQLTLLPVILMAWAIEATRNKKAQERQEKHNEVMMQEIQKISKHTLKEIKNIENSIS